MVSLAPLSIEVTADPTKAEAGLQRVENSLRDTGQAAVNAGNKTRNVARNVAAVGPAAAKSSPQLRMMSMQLSQVAQQGAVTGRYMQALVVQAPDLALGFGTVGIAIGALIPILYGVGTAMFSTGDAAEDTAESILTSYSSLASSADALRGSQDRYTAAIRLSGQASSEITPTILENLRLEMEARQALFDLERAEFELRRLALQQTVEASRARIDALVAEETATLDLSEANNGLYRSQADRERLAIAQEIVASRNEETAALRRDQAELDLINALLAGNLGKVNEIVDAEIAAAEKAGEVNDAWVAVKDTIDSIDLSGVVTQTGNLAARAWDAAAGFSAAAQAFKAQSAAVGGGRGGDPSQFDDRSGQLGDQFGFRGQLTGPENVTTTTPSGGGGGGGGGGVNPIIAELEAVQQALATQEQLQIETFERQQETLQAALEQRLLTQQEYNALMEAAAVDHSDAMVDIEMAAQAAKLSGISGAFGDLASLMNTQNKGLQRIGEAAAKAQIITEGYQAASSAWAKGMQIGGPPVAAAFTAASLVKSAALLAGVGSGSLGAGGGGGGGTPSTAVESASKTVNVVIEGATGPAQSLADQLSEEIANGYTITGITTR